VTKIPGIQPFLKWAGGKRHLAAAVLARAPKTFTRYVEPFAGGGAVFFALRARGFTGPAILCDANEELVTTYVAVRDEPRAVLGFLRDMERHYLTEDANGRAALYRGERGNTYHTNAGIAARMIFLNRTCFNGLYRVNRAGQFNVPHGRYKAPRICDEAGLRAASAALRNTEFWTTRTAGGIGTGDFVYLDPPYLPASKTANFTAYARGGFRLVDHGLLLADAERWAFRGAHVLISNADTETSRLLYAGHHVRKLTARRSVGAAGHTRKRAAELLVTVRVPKARAA
jgi:DNA adenine methylase